MVIENTPSKRRTESSLRLVTPDKGQAAQNLDNLVKNQTYGYPSTDSEMPRCASTHCA